VVDYFSQQAHNPYEQAETLDDVRVGLHIVRTLLQMGRYQQAFNAYKGDLANALCFNLEAYAEELSLLRPFFKLSWATLPEGLIGSAAFDLANNAAGCLNEIGEQAEALSARNAAIPAALRQENRLYLLAGLRNISIVFSVQNRLARQDRCLILADDLAGVTNMRLELFCVRLDRFLQLARLGRRDQAEHMWRLLDPMGRDWLRISYRPGAAEYRYARFRFMQGNLTEEHLTRAEQLAKAGKNRRTLRELHSLRGKWHLEQSQWWLAAESLHEAVRMAREVGQTDASAETRLALAKFHLDQLPDPCGDAEQLANAKNPAHRPLAELWLAIGNAEEAKLHALAAFEWAWADGEPYVHRYELNKATALLEQLGAEIPTLPPYDPAKDEKLPWEDEVRAAIEKLRAEKTAKKAAKSSEEE
jgi:hypothetical protein